MFRELSTESLTCELTHEEVHHRAKELAQVAHELNLAKESAKEEADRAKRRIKAIESKGGTLAQEVRTERTIRRVSVVSHFDFRAAEVRRIRLDTQAVIDVRPMTADEGQQLLPLWEKEQHHPRDAADFQAELQAFLARQAEEEARKAKAAAEEAEAPDGEAVPEGMDETMDDELPESLN